MAKRAYNPYAVCSNLTRDVPQRDRLYTVDLKALNHILNRSMDYFKPEAPKFYLMQTLGGGELGLSALHARPR